MTDGLPPIMSLCDTAAARCVQAGYFIRCKVFQSKRIASRPKAANRPRTGAARRWAVVLGIILTTLEFDLALGADLADHKEVENRNPITNPQEFYALPAEAIASGVPVQIRGTITYLDPEWHILFIQTADRGLFYSLRAEENLKLGDEAELVGRSTLEGTEYRLADVRVLPSGRNRMVEPLKVTGANMPAAARSLRWVELEGRVRWAMILDGRLHLGVGAGTNLVLARVLPPNYLDVNRLVDATVRLKGVAADLDDLRTPRIKTQLYCPGESFLRAVSFSKRDPFSAPLEAIHALVSQGSLPGGERVHAQGFVVDQVIGTSLRIRDHTGMADVETTQPERFDIGSPVDVAGFPSGRAGRLLLSDAVVRSSRMTMPVASPSPAPPGTADAASLPVLTNLAAVCALSHAESARGYPVRLHAVVTRVIPQWQSMFLADETGSIYLGAAGIDPRLNTCQAGDAIEIEAVTGRGDLKPVLEKARLLTAASGHALPRAFPARAIDLYAGGQDCELVEVCGRVIGLTITDDIQLQLDDNGTSFTAMVPGKAIPTNLLGSTVRLRGVCAGRFDGRGNTMEVTLWANSLADVTVEQPAGAEPVPFSSLVSSNLTTPDLRRLLNCRVVAEGIVLLAVPGQSLDFVCNEKGVRALLADTAGLGRGDRVAVTGSFGIRNNQVLIRGATARRLGDGVVPHARVLPPERLLDAAFDQDLVQVEARVLGQSVRGGEHLLMLQAAGWTFEAFAGGGDAPTKLRSAQAGSVVRVRGVYVLETGPNVNGSGFHLQFDPAHDLEVITPAPWWTWRHTLGLAGLFALGLLGTLLWIKQLRRRVSTQTEHIRARFEKEVALERTNRDLVTNASDTIFSADVQGRLTSVNPAGERLLGCASEQLLQRTLADLVVPEHRPLVQRILSPAAPTDAAPTYQLDLLGPERRRLTVELSNRPVMEAGQLVGFQGIVRDITKRKQLEEQLRQAQKTEAIGHLAGGVAHDFNNLLTVITGHVDLLRAEAAPDSGMAGSLQEVAQAADRAAGLTRQLLAYGRRQRMESRVLDLNEVIANFTRMLHRLIGEDIILQCRLGAGLPPVQGDPGMLEQVLMNLVVNARDAMPKGGCIEISTAATTLTQAQARQRVEARSGRFVILSVRDTGCGMAAATLERLFEPFFTTKDVGKGSGLGLSVAEGIIKQHQGWFEVESTKDQGSKFSCFLPASNGVERRGPEKIPAPGIHGGRETILVVEDEQPVRHLVTRVLKRHGYTVLEAATGTEALALWGKHGTGVTLLLTDLVMPDGITGRELAQRLTGLRPDLKVLFSSGYSVDMNDPMVAAEGGRNFLQKPYNTDALLVAVRACLDRETRFGVVGTEETAPRVV